MLPIPVLFAALLAPPTFQSQDWTSETLRSSEPAATRRVTVVHAQTGEPITGAEVLGVAEISTPTWGELWYRHRAMTGADGTVRFPISTDEAPYGWLFVRAAGFGTRAAGNTIEFLPRDPADLRIELMPETPITVELLDFAGSPLPLAHLGVSFGCGHTPDLINATTGPDGTALLKGLYDYDGGIKDLFIVHPEVWRGSYSHVPMEDAQDGVVRVFAPASGQLVRGQLLMPDGSPAVDYAVGGRETHRGPWAITDERGEFQLFGWDAVASYLPVHDREGMLIASFEKARAGHFRTLQLDGTTEPERFVDGAEDVEVPMMQLRFELSMEGTGGGVLRSYDRWIPIQVWDPVTGMAFDAETDADGIATLRVPHGHYLMEAGRVGSPYPPIGLGEAHATVADTHQEALPTTVTAVLPQPRTVTLVVPGYVTGDQLSVYTRVTGVSFSPEDSGLFSEGVAVSADGALTVERFAVPYGRIGFRLERKSGQTVLLEVDRVSRGTDRWVLVPR